MIRSLELLETVLIVVVMGSLFTGCNLEKRKLNAEQKAIIQQDEKLAESYLKGDVAHARKCLLKEAALLKNVTILVPSGRAQLLATAFSRLYVLEMRDGNTNAAAADLIKLRYWSLENEELSGTPPEEAARLVNRLSCERIVASIDRLDKDVNEGKEPEYVKSCHRH